MIWKVDIPVRPKCVQSTAFRAGQGCYEPKEVRQWKASIKPFIKAAAPEKPSKLPIEILNITYSLKLPKAAPSDIRQYIEQGGVVPCLKHMDVTDNLNKGLIDVCKGIIFEDDSQIWRTQNIRKIWALEDHIHMEFRECPDFPLVTGGYGADLANETRE